MYWHINTNITVICKTIFLVKYIIFLFLRVKSILFCIKSVLGLVFYYGIIVTDISSVNPVCKQSLHHS